ncbi:MAG: thiamine diphosphokinase [Hyphomonadaceae bacterium]|nr:thiamine diphosphokinase [Clostridia bacterium]
MKAAVIASGSFSPHLMHWLLDADCVVCADGGADYLMGTDVLPDVIVGDLDSITPQAVAYYEQKKVPFVTYDVHKDLTDMEIALSYALDKGATEIVLLGASGSRFDHSYANVTLLKRLQQQSVNAILVHPDYTVQVMGQTTQITGNIGQTVSILPFSETVAGITLQGFRYPLKQFTMTLGMTIGVSNVIEQIPATIEIEDGWLMVVVNQNV